ncbi:MAG TPA: hypothetical protein VGH64_11105, partial [Puia sp.]
MSLHEFIFSDRQKKRIGRHAVLWILCYAYLVICNPPYAAGGQDELKMTAVTFYQIASLRGLFSLLGQMVFCYPLLYILMPVYFWKKKYIQFISLLLL